MELCSHRILKDVIKRIKSTWKKKRENMENRRKTRVELSTSYVETRKSQRKWTRRKCTIIYISTWSEYKRKRDNEKASATRMFESCVVKFKHHRIEGMLACVLTACYETNLSRPRAEYSRHVRTTNTYLAIVLLGQSINSLYSFDYSIFLRAESSICTSKGA